jgi:sulfite exporter TauE/SafE
MLTLTETFIFGAASSLHCAGMCGPLAMCFRGGKLGALGYHLGRVVSYSIVGAIAGALGTVLGTTILPSEWISIALSAVLIGFAMGSRRLFSIGWTPPFLGRVFAKARSLPPVTSGLCVGLVTPLLPCGVLYIAVGTALVSRSAVNGAATLMMFALGSLPVLLLTQMNFGLLASRLGPDGRARLFRFMMIAAAAVLMYRGIASLAGSSCH